MYLPSAKDLLIDTKKNLKEFEEKLKDLDGEIEKMEELKKQTKQEHREGK